jgi:PTH1 family peptidyl-tRNA hydrolase
LRSAAGHHGMESILEAMGTDQVPRLRFGIGVPAGAKGADFVLSDFDAAERPVVESAIDRSVEAIRCVWTAGMAQAMSLFNRDPSGG